ncbi:T9SS type A sorting domain-containing protein [Segetibacter sp. 3557_3]|uniref:reprolysin-like metallopeptidase n=1 Tax=Segetibacter sp. 3557_3 TaxID=2547429 RepID=UPI00105872EA|nr:fibronectin type III domain-containing protein [Segetibacter sp. 3557_3]TDH20683.1 T9SS type A sorting domain-containing protein [Segetibacter sp. 3557_3]
MKKILLLTQVFVLFTVAAFSQSDRFWTMNNESRTSIVTDKSVSRLSYPTAFKLFNLNAAPFQQQLFAIVGASAAKRATVISIPNADGNLEDFEVVEASNFEPELQARFPEIRAFSGKGITDKFATLKLSISPDGVQTMVFRTDNDNEFIEPYSKDRKVYAVYRSHREKGQLPWNCTTEEKQLAADINSQVAPVARTGSSSGQLKTLRLAQSCNGEYANYFGATSASQVGLVMAAFNATLTRCNGIYEKDLALHLNLIPTTTSVIYYNPSTDPYTTMSSWNQQLQTTLTNVIGNDNYHIGHMFGASGGGGNAGCIGCVCIDPTSRTPLGKGSGITSPADGVPMGDNFDIDYVAHEVGHQLGANHTFSKSLEGTGVNKEVGSGITIMGYAGITAQDVAPHSIDIFHQTSIEQIQANLAGKSCPVSVSAGNTAPVIAPVSNYTIPISTPFALTASATDADRDALTYCWEQNDNSTTSGTGSVASPTKLTGPNWLTFPASQSGTRSFPTLATILRGAMITGPLAGGDAGANIEALSSVTRALNFRVTVRDNHPYSATSVAQTSFADVVVNVTNTAGPFKVTAPDTNVSLPAGSETIVTWSVNGTNTGVVNCQAVNILLSTDGGTTFTTLVSGTANDGDEVVRLPATSGTTNRIKVEAVGNIFFDISDANFTIGQATVTCANPTALTASAITSTSATVSWTAAAGANSYAVDYKSAESTTWLTVTGNTTGTSVNLSGLLPGTTYDYRVRSTCSAGTSSYTQARFTTTGVACASPTGLTSSAITETSATVAWTASSGANSYAVDYKTTSSLSWLAATANTTTPSVNLTGLNAGTSYDWRVRANCIGGSSSNVQAQFTTPAPPSTCPGSSDGSGNGTTGGAALIALNTEIKGRIDVRGDVDYYKFVVTTQQNITISLSTLPADYQLDLLSSSGALVQSSATTGLANETITRTLAAGDFFVKVYPKNNGAFNASACYTLAVTPATTRMADAENIEYVGTKLNVAPNPARASVKLAFNSELRGNAMVMVINQTGSIVLKRNLAVNAGANNSALDISNLSNGVYILRIQTGTATQLAKLVIAK